MEVSGAGLWALCLGVGLLPVLAFLIGLVLLDSYKLMHVSAVAMALAGGAAAAGACLLLNSRLPSLLELDFATYSRYAAPVVEELLKGSVIALAVWRRRIGFLVDAAIWGFAVGAGFAAVENVQYFRILAEPQLGVWIIRGFGTAIMHGSMSAILAISFLYLSERFDSVLPHLFLPGWLLATALHSFFNHFVLSPSLSTAALVLGMPVVFMLVFEVGEKATHAWLGSSFDGDQDLLRSILAGELRGTRVGEYLERLKARFSPADVVDMVGLIRLRAELSILAKGRLMMRKAGFSPPPDPRVASRFRELSQLEEAIGRTGRLALAPIFPTGQREVWQLHRLRKG